jgi:cellulose synthase/poly-beta-1,6-N-acetylglucosamine synthase-like glycosyltransferase
MHNQLLQEVNLTKYPFISIIVSIRNEKNNAEEFVKQIEKQCYPKQHFELIVIDDASLDFSYEAFDEVLKKMEIQFFLKKQINHKGKKTNISEGISMAKGSIIVTTDADVIYRDTHWLHHIAFEFQNKETNMLIMPVDFSEDNSALAAFQITENLALAGIAAGYCMLQKPFLCNGANLAFTKKGFEKVNGYASHIAMSSGEDVFLLEDLKRLGPHFIRYANRAECIVKTKSITTTSDFFQQRLRWAAKSTQNPNWLNVVLGGVVLFANMIIVVFVFALIMNITDLYYLGIFTFIKLMFDFLLLFLASRFVGKRKYLAFLMPLECVYGMYAVVVALGALFFKPYWKGIKIN